MRRSSLHEAVSPEPVRTVAAPWLSAYTSPFPLAPGEKVLLVGAHPDDETIGAGRLVAEHDGPMSGMSLTWGEKCVPALEPEPMARRRHEEWRSALLRLGVSAIDTERRWPDGELAEHEDEVVEALVGIARGFDVLVATSRRDPHPDHAAAGWASSVAAEAVGARLVEYPVRAPYWTREDELARRGFRADLVATSPVAGRHAAPCARGVRVPDGAAAAGRGRDRAAGDARATPSSDRDGGQMIDLAGWDSVYRGDPDPFDVASSWYERRKQTLVVASLAREHYAFAWDCAAGTGHLAQELLTAGRCEHLLASDASPTAVGLAAGLLGPAAEVRESALPEVPAAARAADLSIAAEVLYYLPDEARSRAVEALARQGGEVVAVHWRHHPHDAYLSGAAVTLHLDEALRRNGWTRSVWHNDADFVLAGWVESSTP